MSNSSRCERLGFLRSIKNLLHARTVRFRKSIGSVRRVNLQISSCLACATLTMLRVWMLLVVGAAAMRQAAEDVSAHSAVKEGSIGPISYIRKKWRTSRLRSAAEEVAKKNFPEAERQYVTEAVMKAFKSGELDKGLKEMSWEEKQRYLLTTMQHMQDLRSLKRAAEELTKKNFPEVERQYVTEAVMKAFKSGELDKGLKEKSQEDKERYLLTTMQQMQEDLRSLRCKAEELAKKNFPEEERQYVTEAVMIAYQNGELDKGLKEMSWEEKQRYLLTTMQQMQEDLRSLKRAAEELTKKNFPEEGRQRLTEAVMEAFKNGDLDKGLKEMSREDKERYLLATMQQMQEDLRSLRSKAEEVAKEHFPEKERAHLTEGVMEAFKNRELHEESMFDTPYLLQTMNRLRELPVAASAVKFCSNLFREAFREASRAGQLRARDLPLAESHAEQEAKEAAGICHKVLTGELGPHDGPKWAEKAANSSQPEGQHYQLGRLEKVNATEKAWKVSLKNVCRDECIELVYFMRMQGGWIIGDVGKRHQPPSYEEVCATRVVQKVEAEILGCCAESCGWNGRACMYWPFLNSTEKGQWEAECCTEFNILKNSSRATMCDSTLTGKENNEVIRDEQPNTEEEREMIGQDPVGRGTSFLQEEDTNGPSPPPENKPIPAPERTCPPPLDLGKIHEKLKDEWKTTNFQLARKKNFKKEFCLQKKLKDSIGNCTAFLPQDENSTYMCYGHCLVSGEGLKFTNLTAEIPSNSQLLYVHETIYNSTKSE